MMRIFYQKKTNIELFEKDYSNDPKIYQGIDLDEDYWGVLEDEEI